jgi:glycosyltransferase involved in cell wall biosynthesis
LILVIVPTRNRRFLLKELLLNLEPNVNSNFNIVIVDSSDEFFPLEVASYPCNVIQIHTEKQSAAIQRNIALEIMDERTEFVFFLDDDVRIKSGYFEKLIEILSRPGVVGASGVALNPLAKFKRKPPKGIRGIFYRLFLLDSKHDGKLLRSGVNIPVRNYRGEAIEVDWLIACSAWKSRFIGKTRFEADFWGASLAEDVIFSRRMAKNGLLMTDPSVILDHLESVESRISKRNFWKMWVVNRLRVVEISNFGYLGYLSLIWSSIGQMIISIIGILKGDYNKTEDFLGITFGIVAIVKKSKCI